MAVSKMPRGRTVTSKVVAILDTFARGDAHPLSEIAQLTGLPLSTVHRLVGELRALGVLDRADGSWYRIGPRLRTIGGRPGAPRGWPDSARPIMDDLAGATGALVRLGVLQDLKVTVLQRSGSGNGVLDPVATQGLPVHATALGKALLAYARPETLEQVLARGLRRYTTATLTKPEQLRATLSQIRASGVAIAGPELTPHSAALAAPIFTAGGGAVAALEVAMRDPGGDLDRLRPALVVAARAMSRELQISGNREARRFSAPS